MNKTAEIKTLLSRAYPWVKSPFIVGAPMRVMSGARLAIAVSEAGGLGFIGPGAKGADTLRELETVEKSLASSGRSSLGDLLPVGVGFQTWNGDIEVAAAAVQKYKPCAAWLFAPRNGQRELDEWTVRIRESSGQTQVWIQVGTIREAVEAARSASPPDVLVIQGAEAGGHGRATDGMGLMTLLPEVHDALGKLGSGIPLFAAGGVADGRGVTAALALGAAGVVMGTRFLAATEAQISKGYQDEIVRASDGATSTTRTQLYNHLRGTFGWPEQFSPRTIVNQSWVDHQAGVPFEELQKRHDAAAAAEGGGWGPDGRLATYAGANVGLIHSVEDAGAIVSSVRNEAVGIITALQSSNQLP
jgi:nitronate monooxygenase